jgi:hypothetical protein
MVTFRDTVAPNPDWQTAYAKGLRKFVKVAGINVPSTKDTRDTKGS